MKNLLLPRVLWIGRQNGRTFEIDRVFEPFEFWIFWIYQNGQRRKIIIHEWNSFPLYLHELYIINVHESLDWFARTNSYGRASFPRFFLQFYTMGLPFIKTRLPSRNSICSIIIDPISKRIEADTDFQRCSIAFGWWAREMKWDTLLRLFIPLTRCTSFLCILPREFW